MISIGKNHRQVHSGQGYNWNGILPMNFLAVALWHCVVRLHEPSGRCLQIVHLRRSLVLVDLQLGGMSDGAEGARDGKKGGARRLHH